MSINIKNLNYIQGKSILEDVSLEIKKGEYCFFIGKTGSGKTSILESIMGLVDLKTLSGEIDILGMSMFQKKEVKKIQKKIAYVFQRCEAHFFNTSIEKELKSSGNVEKGIEILKTLGLDYENIKEDSPFDLSGGEKRKLAITIGLLKEPEILMLDEPTMGLDGKSSRDLMDFLKKLNKDGMTIIQTTHIMEEVLDYSTKAIVVNSGKIAYEGSDVFSQRDILEKSMLEVPFERRLLDALKAKGIDLNKGEVEEFLLNKLC